MAAAFDADALPVGLLRLGLRGEIRHANAWVALTVGCPAEQLVGQHLEAFLAPGGRVLFHTYLMPLLRLHGRLQEFALPLRGAQGLVLEVLVYGTLRETPGDGEIELAVVPMRERRRIETELLRVQRAADAVPGVLFEYVVDSNGNGRIHYASAGVLALYGLTPEQLRESDEPLLARVHPDDVALLAHTRSASRRERHVWSCEFRACRAPGQPWRWHSLQATPRALPDGATAWHGFASDVTAQHELAAAQRERDSAERASLAKSEFLARMSHELRTPLNGIIGFARLLAVDRGELPATEVRRRLSIIENSGRQLLSLINEVLDIARIEAGNVQVLTHPVALAPLMTQTLAALEPMAEVAGVMLHLEADPDLQAQADPTRLAQVLTNLASNAIKYNRPGGQVILAAQADAAGGPWVRLQVTDTGPGLSAAQLAQLFQPFNRLGAEQGRIEGSGLGLVIARHLAELMGGRIEVRSEPGHGSCFELVLPRPPQPAGSASLWTPLDDEAAEEAAPPSVSPAPRRVLYVEDNPVNCLLMQAVLATYPWLTLAVEVDAASALAHAAADPPDLLLLDMHLPDMDGLALLPRLRALPHLALVPAVAVSADAMPEHAADALAAGFDAYWTKPLDVEAVRANVLRLLAGDAG